MAVAFGLRDMHCENAISSYFLDRLQLFPIDCEVALQHSHEGHVDYTNFLREKHGAMSRRSKGPATHNFLVSTEGILPWGSDAIPLKNLVYCERKDKEESEQARSPEPGAFMQGFQEAINCFVSHSEIFKTWFKHPLTKAMSVRILPHDTGVFKRLLRNLCEKDFDRMQFDLQMPTSLSGFIEDFSREGSILIPQDFVVFFHEQTYRDFCHLDIPVYYMRVNDIQLLDSQGNPIIVYHQSVTKRLENLLRSFRTRSFSNTQLQQRRIRQLEDLLNEWKELKNKLIDDPKKYFTKSPLDLSEAFFDRLANLREELCREAQTEIERIQFPISQTVPGREPQPEPKESTGHCSPC